MLISIIIPTLNEASMLPAALASLRRQESDIEIIVCDGGSIDCGVDGRACGGFAVLLTAGEHREAES